ncbi:HD domain-containing protein [Papillibacter cinnamivorans]|uniref:HD domain-containing protein n=1 Tax=Papillibacter cinnamivorans DSM 12816 TaxID=1122930 RepID=A0A1W1ZPA9_9FIRM|nr:HD domain-containing protein [Papillibacter cinnamivorans]SMC50093.1 hypothetical protein SAMN02745168_1262 [Papillibacter cinnamivorans DSM 12816]
MGTVTFETIKNSPEIQAYIRQADVTLEALGYTEHSLAHVTKCAEVASDILQRLGYSHREIELSRIAAFMHDIGNMVNRVDHAQSGAVIAFQILSRMGMDPEDITVVVSSIGNHDEASAIPVNAASAALILADKTDVRRSRVRNPDSSKFDIHDRVNYAVYDSSLDLDTEQKTITLSLRIDTEISAVMDYFEIFLNRMLLCRRAADYLGLRFRLDINDVILL